MSQPLLCYITDRTQFSGTDSNRRKKLLSKIREAAACGIDFIQLREKDLSNRELEKLAREVLGIIRSQNNSRTRLLINSRSDIALGVGADGVHLRSDDISVADARKIARLVSGNRNAETADWIVSVSCHSEDEVCAVASADADFAVFAPVFEKAGSRPAGLDALRWASQYKIPVLALGGVTLDNAKSCVEAGAAGVAGIRLFQDNEIRDVFRHMKKGSRAL
jgi:thiamine-phosphate pyrophosphorylase